MDEWDAQLERWTDERHVFAQLADTAWVSLAEAEAETGVSRSALRSWYRNGEIPSRMVEGRNGPQRIVPLAAVIERARSSPRIQRRAERELTLEALVALLHQRVDLLERRLATLEHPPAPPT